MSFPENIKVRLSNEKKFHKNIIEKKICLIQI
jgi:hypothetical protein